MNQPVSQRIALSLMLQYSFTNLRVCKEAAMSQTCTWDWDGIQAVEVTYLRTVKGCTRAHQLRNEDVRSELVLFPLYAEIIECRDKWKIHLQRDSLAFHTKPLNIACLIEETLEDQEECGRRRNNIRGLNRCSPNLWSDDYDDEVSMSVYLTMMSKLYRQAVP
jgi:hypothetical protein